MSVLVYDVKVKHIPWDGKSYKMKRYEYAEGWKDYEGLGVACICAWSSKFGGYGIFTEVFDYPEIVFKNRVTEIGGALITIAPIPDFQKWVNAHAVIAGYNSREFDDKVIAFCGIQCKTNYDVLQEIYAAIGLDPNYSFPEDRKEEWKKYTGYKLEDVAKANFGRGKIGHGAMAPIQWQDGEHEAVIRYCLDDVKLERDLFLKSQAGELLAPNGKLLQMRKLEEAKH